MRLIETARLMCARADLAIRGAASAPIRGADVCQNGPTITGIRGHRVTLIRRRLFRRPLIITTPGNASHALALDDLRAMYAQYTGRPYRPRSGDTLVHEVAA